MDDDAICALVARLARPHASGGQVVERAAILAEGADFAAVMAWIAAHGGKPETTASSAPRRGLPASGLPDSGRAEPRTPLRIVLPAGATASRGGRLPVLAEREASSTEVPEEGVELLRTADGKGDGVLATRPFAAGETVMVGFLVGPLTGNDAHATQVGPGRWALHGGLGPKVNHSCDPNCGVRLNDGQAFDFVARQPIAAEQEVTFDYAMRNFTIEHFPAVCLCGAARCRGSITGWKDLPAARKEDYGELVAPYLRTMDDEIRQALGHSAGG